MVHEDAGCLYILLAIQLFKLRSEMRALSGREVFANSMAETYLMEKDPWAETRFDNRRPTPGRTQNLSPKKAITFG